MANGKENKTAHPILTLIRDFVIIQVLVSAGTLFYTATEIGRSVDLIIPPYVGLALGICIVGLLAKENMWKRMALMTFLYWVVGVVFKILSGITSAEAFTFPIPFIAVAFVVGGGFATVIRLVSKERSFG